MIRGYFDGASRGNPGCAGAGAVIVEDGKVIWRRANPLGMKTNNEAEYYALAMLLDELERRCARGAEIYGDSKLVVSQVSGAWKIKEPRLRALAEPIIARVKALNAVCRWVPREQNAEADKMSNWALDKGDFEEHVQSSPAQPDAPSADNMQIRQADLNIWIVCDGSEKYAVDLVHECCTCGKTHCRHMERVLAALRDASCGKGSFTEK